jgi:hypothetical protein
MLKPALIKTRGLFAKRRVAEALACEPDQLPPVEMELRPPPPRKPIVYKSTDHGHGSLDELRRLHRIGIATRAWCTEVKGGFEYFNGAMVNDVPPDFRYAFRDESRNLFLARFNLHEIWESHNSNVEGATLAGALVPEDNLEHWINRAFCDEGTFTVLYPRGRPEEHLIYGLMVPLIQKNLDSLLDEFKSSRESEFNEIVTQELYDYVFRAFSLLGILHIEDESVVDAFLNSICSLAGCPPLTNLPKHREDESWPDLDVVSQACQAIMSGLADPKVVEALAEACNRIGSTFCLSVR